MATSQAPGNEGSGAQMSNGEHENAKSWTISGFHGLKRIGPAYEFTVDLNAFNDLVLETYRSICGILPEYSQNISLGMYSYYVGTVLWYRLYALKDAQWRGWAGVLATIKSRCSNGFVIPEPICKFFDVIGDFIDLNGCYWRFVSCCLDSFGEVTSHNFYEFLGCPAPEILTAYLREEMNVIVGEKDPGEWRLNSIDFENCPDNLKFSENVCGYFQPLNPSWYNANIDSPVRKQLSTALEEIKQSNEKKQEDCDWISPTLIAHITKYHENQCKAYPMKLYSNESKYGSIVQIGFVECLGSNDLRVFSPAMLPDSVSSLIPVFRLRIKRDPNDVRVYPYYFTSINDVPESWLVELNNNFNYGDAETQLNLPIFSTGVVDRTSAIAEYVQSFLAETSG